MNHPLTTKEIRNMLIENLTIDLAVSYAEEQKILIGMKANSKRKVESQSEQNIRAFASFKMKIVLTKNRFYGYQNTENELFEIFMLATNDYNLFLEWDNETKKVILQRPSH